VERGIEPHVGVLTFDRTRHERPHLLIEDLADPGNLRAGDAIDPERVDQVVDLAGRDALDLGLDDHGMKGLLRPPTRLKERREVGACRDLRDLELDRADPGVPGPRAVAVAIGGAFGAALVGGGTDLAGDLGLHHSLRKHPDAFTQQIHVVPVEKLADERRDVHPWGGHRPSSSDCAVVEDGGGPLRHGVSTPDLHRESPPLLGTLTVYRAVRVAWSTDGEDDAPATGAERMTADVVPILREALRRHRFLDGSHPDSRSLLPRSRRVIRRTRPSGTWRCVALATSSDGTGASSVSLIPAGRSTSPESVTRRYHLNARNRL